MPESSEARPPAAADRVYAFTKELIISGELAGGSLISEGEIADRVGVSRTPVREAFLRLRGEELLELFPKRGAVVVPMAPGEAEDVLELREALECAAVRRILRFPGAALDDLLDRLRDVLRDQRAPAERADVPAFTRVDELFHRSIVSGSGNALAARFYASLGDRQRRMAAHHLAHRAAHLDVLVREHTALVEAIAGRDADAFAATLRAHLTATHRALGVPARD